MRNRSLHQASISLCHRWNFIVFACLFFYSYSRSLSTLHQHCYWNENKNKETWQKSKKNVFNWLFWDGIKDEEERGPGSHLFNCKRGKKTQFNSWATQIQTDKRAHLLSLPRSCSCSYSSLKMRVNKVEWVGVHTQPAERNWKKMLSAYFFLLVNPVIPVQHLLSSNRAWKQ